MAPRLLVTDPSPVFRKSLRHLLEAEAPEWEIVGEAATASESLSTARRLDPDVILLEKRLEDSDGLDVLPSLREASPDAHVLMISFDWDPATRRTALERGARGVLLKDDADHLVEALRDVSAGAGPTPRGGRR